MPATEDKTLSQTIREVMTEPAKASTTNLVQAAEGISEGTSGETQSGGTPEYVSGVDISTLPEQERTIARKVLAEKGKLLEDGYQAKFKEVSKFKKQREELLSLGISEEEAVSAIRNHIDSKTNAKDAKKEAVRMIDKLKESAPDLETRKGFENLENIIMELTNIGDIKSKLEQLERIVGQGQIREAQTREQSVVSSLGGLEKEYGKNIIDKYREDVLKQGLAFPDVDPERLLHAIADPKELKQALLANSVEKKDRKQEKINAITPTGSGVTAPIQEVDVRKTPMKNILNQLFSK